MSKTAATLAAGLAALACAGSARAHHSGLMYQTTPTWISGTVIYVELRDPHTVITWEDSRQGGNVGLWAVEGPARAEVDRRSSSEQLPKVGDTVTVCAFPYRSAEEIANDSRILKGDPSTKRSSPASSQPVAGHVIVMPDGEMKFWEPHGVTSECMRGAADKRKAWLDSLNANPTRRESWCGQWRYAVGQANSALKKFVEEINSSLDEPCR